MFSTYTSGDSKSTGGIIGLGVNEITQSALKCKLAAPFMCSIQVGAAKCSFEPELQNQNT